VALVTDDAGVARSTMTLEFRKAVEEHALDYRTLKRMVHNSLEYSFADEATKGRLRSGLEEAFKVFERRTGRGLGTRGLGTGDSGTNDQRPTTDDQRLKIK
jgi:adenosine deaminase